MLSFPTFISIIAFILKIYFPIFSIAVAILLLLFQGLYSVDTNSIKLPHTERNITEHEILALHEAGYKADSKACEYLG